MIEDLDDYFQQKRGSTGIPLAAYTREDGALPTGTAEDPDPGFGTPSILEELIRRAPHVGKADVTGFHQDLGPVKGAKIVTAAVAYDNQDNRDTYLLIFNQVLFLAGLDHHLINPFQLRDNGILVNDIPLIHTNIEDRTTSTHSITVPSVNLQIPLQLNGVLSGFKVRKPTNREINDLFQCYYDDNRFP